MSENLVLPPWIQFPNNPPWWSGWQVGEPERWLREVWFPFFNAYSREDQLTYLKYRKVPEDWLDHILEFWVHSEPDVFDVDSI